MSKLALVWMVVVGSLISLEGACTNRAALDAAKDQALQEYRECLKSATREFDDGTSELRQIALAVKARCGPQFLAWVKASSAHLPEGYATLFVIDTEPKALESAETAVAIYRSHSRSKQ